MEPKLGGFSIISKLRGGGEDRLGGWGREPFLPHLSLHNLPLGDDTNPKYAGTGGLAIWRFGGLAGWLAGSLAIELPSHHVTNLASLIDGRSPLTRK